MRGHPGLDSRDGQVRVAHTEHERISKAELVQAVEIYVKMVKNLKKGTG